MTIAHVSITVPKAKLDETVEFYEAALKPLGYKIMMRPAEGVVGLGNSMAPDMWIAVENEKMRAGGQAHICFYGKSKSHRGRYPAHIPSTEVFLAACKLAR